MKKLTRSEENKIIFGILGGIGEFYKIDPVLVRLGYVILLFATGVLPLTLAYFVAWFVVPKKK